MATTPLIAVDVFGIEIGKLGYDADQKKCYFQYNADFLASGNFTNLFPFVFKRIQSVQVFTQFEGETFRGLPPMIADSLPDVFGNIIFQEWFSRRAPNKKISPLEQLTYVANRGMGALEYRPVQNLPESAAIDVSEMVQVLEKVLQLKEETTAHELNELALFNIFKIGTSAGGARPKILISEHKRTRQIVAGDKHFSDDYFHYLVKLHLPEQAPYHQEKVEYAYFLLALQAGIEMMPSKLIDDKHFATLRYDRQNGEKQHVLTASGLTGWDFTKPEYSSYENVFKLATTLQVPHKDLHQLFKRMVFNLIFQNSDDHLKNHSFIFDKEKNNWHLAPAYDITYALNPLLNYTSVSRALSINNKRQNINLKDVLTVAEAYAIKNPKGIIEEIEQVLLQWQIIAKELEIPEKITNRIENDFMKLS
ncbi:type II toxin-antitoxin system HipA family toxin [Flavobacterium orientale]|uniref:Toxin HipA n=1 Tax=Flavobacterium orientale TaxID=1756020 RepID=A0A916XX31_9FLAO|nr:type II toxin-antitoxin system HipA family toxin [Flavobacterium orientale]GGD18303.1 toxin HipA [Flavobacterium orientale]